MTGRVRADWQFVGFAAILAAGAPGGVLMHGYGIPAQLVLAAIGLLAWWYLSRGRAGTLAARLLRWDDSGPALVPWTVFVGAFYGVGLPLGRAWRDCPVGEAGTNMVHVLVSAALAGTVAVTLWGALRRATDGRSVLLPVLVSLAAAVVLLWPAMAVWHLLAGTAAEVCAPDTIPAWWPSWLPIG